MRGQPESMVGLQGRVSPVALKVKEVLKQGRIGKVLSSDVRMFGTLVKRDAVWSFLRYFKDRTAGGNPVTIAFAHMLDLVHDVVGDFEDFQGRMQIQ